MVRCAAGRSQVIAASSSGPVLDITAPATRENVGRLRRKVVALCSEAGIGEHEQSRVALAVSEALTNVVLHAYSDDVSAGNLRLVASVAAGQLDVQVIDYGKGLGPRPDSPGLGVGLSVMRRCADVMQTMATKHGGTTIGLRWRFGTDTRAA